MQKLFKYLKILFYIAQYYFSKLKLVIKLYNFVRTLDVLV